MNVLTCFNLTPLIITPTIWFSVFSLLPTTRTVIRLLFLPVLLYIGLKAGLQLGDSSRAIPRLLLCACKFNPVALAIARPLLWVEQILTFLRHDYQEPIICFDFLSGLRKMPHSPVLFSLALIHKMNSTLCYAEKKTMEKVTIGTEVMSLLRQFQQSQSPIVQSNYLSFENVDKFHLFDKPMILFLFTSLCTNRIQRQHFSLRGNSLLQIAYEIFPKTKGFPRIFR